MLEDNINAYLKEFRYPSVRIDNKDKYNYYVTSTTDKISKQNVDKYIEIYYRDPSVYTYLIKTDTITAKVMIVLTIFAIVLLLKIIINSVINSKNIHLEIKVLKRLIYVLRYGYKYKNTRNKIMISFGGAIAVILVYLYLIAGIRNQNVLITFLTRYPFKGTLILVLIPLVCVLYSLKKSLDISVINDGLKKINSGELEYKISDIGEREVKELVENINQIREGYIIALNEKTEVQKD